MWLYSHRLLKFDDPNAGTHAPGVTGDDLLYAPVFSIFEAVPFEPSEPTISGEAESITGRPGSGPWYGLGDPERNPSASATLK